MKTVNIGILAHVDAGKTSLTEAILFETKTIGKLGRVDKGNTQTDSMELEKRRGITIKASAISFMSNDLKVNLLDTPGHTDFISEVERSLMVLDGAVLIISAVEGVQAQTKVLMDALLKLKIPAIFFINKIDREGANTENVIKAIKEKLTSQVTPIYYAENEGSTDAHLVRHSVDDRFMDQCVDTLSVNDENILEQYLSEDGIDSDGLTAEIIRQAKRAQVFPLFVGSAMRQIGIKELIKGIEMFLPVNETAQNLQQESDVSSPSALVFKIERGPLGEKKYFVRVFKGALQLRESITIHRKTRTDGTEIHKEKITEIEIFDKGKTMHAGRLEHGDIGVIKGPKNLKIGDVIGEWTDQIRFVSFAEPNMETKIDPVHVEEVHHLFEALTVFVN